MILTVSSFAFCFVKKRLTHNQSRSVSKTSLNARLHGFSGIGNHMCHRLDLYCKRSKKGMLLFLYVIYSPLSLWFPFPFIFLIPPYYYTNTNCMYRYIYVTSPICMSTSMPQCTCHIAVQQRSSRLRCTALTL